MIMAQSKVLQRLLDRVPQEEKILMKMQSDIISRINEVLREKGWSQKKLAEKLDKRPSEISKWLSGEHNFTLKSLAKLEAELGEEILSVPQSRSFNYIKHPNYRRQHNFKVYKNPNYAPKNSDEYIAASGINLSVSKKIA